MEGTQMGAHILVVDDDDGIRKLVTRMLEDAGHEVVATGDGLAALNAVLSAGKSFDLVITNNCMPRMGGAELIARLRQAYPTIPIIHLDDLSRVDAPALPADVPNIHKPFHAESLLRAIEQILADAKTHQESDR
jgi:two-component system cell cycle sensor histidine kinase/response regulator CckA